MTHDPLCERSPRRKQDCDCDLISKARADTLDKVSARLDAEYDNEVMTRFEGRPTAPYNRGVMDGLLVAKHAVSMTRALL